MRYDVLRNPSLDDLIGFVNKRLVGGWELEGGISIGVLPGGNRVYMQAMTKESEKIDLNMQRITEIIVEGEEEKDASN